MMSVNDVKKRPRPERRMLRTSDAAHYLGLSEATIKRMALAGELRYIKRPGAHTPYLFDVRDLDRWIEQNRTAAAC
jgi:excisionase family DNA binding protein